MRSRRLDSIVVQPVSYDLARCSRCSLSQDARDDRPSVRITRVAPTLDLHAKRAAASGFTQIPFAPQRDTSASPDIFLLKLGENGEEADHRAPHRIGRVEGLGG